MISDSELLTLQREMYGAAAVYHGALASYIAASSPSAAHDVLARGHEYGAAMRRVLARLRAAPFKDEKEIARVERLIELLDIELNRLPQQ